MNAGTGADGASRATEAWAPPLADAKVDALCARLGVTTEGRRQLDRVRGGGPERLVRSRHRNAGGRFPSRKMGCVIQFESSVEQRAVMLLYEHDDAVLEFWDQPLALRLRYTRADGKVVAFDNTPDFLVVTRDGVFLDEWKTEAFLARESLRDPRRWVRADGGWECPPAAEAAARLGFAYRLRTSGEVDPVMEANVRFLAAYDRDPSAVGAAARGAVLAAVASSPGVSTADLLAQVAGSATADDVNRMLLAGDLWFDWASVKLADTRFTRLFADERVGRAWLASARPGGPAAAAHVDLAAGVEVLWDGNPWTVVNAGATEVALRAPDAGVVRLPVDDARRMASDGTLRPAAGDRRAEVADAFGRASLEDQREAARRWHLLQDPALARAAGVPDRTLRHWRRAHRVAEESCGVGLVGLLPRRTGSPGGSRLPAATERLIERGIEQYYGTATAPSVTALVALVTGWCRDEGLEPPSRSSVERRVRARDRWRLDLARRGAKAAYPKQPFHWTLEYGTERHGDRPFEVVHVDHTLVDVELVDQETGAGLGRPWLSLATDAYTRRVLATYLTFDEPSYRSVLCLFDAMVARHGRLPEAVVVDGGAEFHSAWFEVFAAQHEMTVKVRPGQPRFGSVVERLFGTANTGLFHNLLGNTKATRLVRQMTPQVDPVRHAVWTLADLRAAVEEYTTETYDARPHPALGTSPRAAHAEAMRLMGDRPARIVPYDEAFRMSTLATTDSGDARVDAVRGVQVRYLRYRADEFRAPGVHGTRVRVRYDPKDMRSVLAYVGGRWVRAWCTEIRQLPPITEKELEVVSAEWRARRSALGSGRAALSGQVLVEQYQRLADAERVLLQRRRDAALLQRPVAYQRLAATPPGSPPDAPGREPDAPGREPDTPEPGRLAREREPGPPPAAAVAGAGDADLYPRWD